MPRREDGEDKELGIHYEGDVLRGRLGVREAVLRSDLRARNCGGAWYSSEEMAAQLARGEVWSIKMLNPLKGEEGAESGRGDPQGGWNESPAEVAKAVLRRLGG